VISVSKLTKVSAAIVMAALFGFSLLWFQPWRLFTSSEVSEAPPATIVPSDSTSSSESEPAPADVVDPKLLLSGELISHEHETYGFVRILELEDGTRILRLEGFSTSDGPDLEVWLSDAEVVEGFDGWFLADDGDYLSLGKLKGTKGEQNYEIPAEVALERFSSMSIWCVRFAVSFGAAELVPREQ
jgi:hypothetical protein